jgi:rhodanese-related sulfurtransferase/predicted double-glycine peptidase
MSRTYRRSLLLCLTICFLSPPPIQAAENSSFTEQASGPYCGLYCVYSVLKSYGIPVDFERFLDPKYISSWEGTSMEQLKLLIEDHGAYALPMESLTISSLRACPHPVILHVRAPGPGMPYAHWVLFLGVEGDYAWIVDPPLKKQRLPLAELLAIWDSTGLIVSKEPFSPYMLRLWTYTEQTLIFVLLLCVMAGAYWCFPQRWWRTPLVITLSLLSVAFVYHLGYEHGMMANRSAVAAVQGNHFFPPMPSIDWDELQEMLRHEETILVDARTAWAYRLGHIPRSINLPINAGLVERREVLASLRPSQPVIVYCQSEQCNWGEVIAVDLHFRGFRHVYVYRGGYVEWQQREQQQRNPSAP